MATAAAAIPSWQQATDGAALRSRLVDRTYAIEQSEGTDEGPDGDGAKVGSREGEGIETFGHRLLGRSAQTGAMAVNWGSR